MANGESRLLLYVFVANDDKIAELNHTYARSEGEARVQLMPWMAQQAALGRNDIMVKHWPGGFQAGHRVRWPGSLPASQAVQNREAGQ
jgi:hypothetical protein